MKSIWFPGLARDSERILTVAGALRKHSSRPATVLLAIGMRGIDESLVGMIT
jgi:hypothetical protein